MPMKQRNAIRFRSLLLTTTITVLITSLVPLPGRATPGDANCDGEVTAEDVASVVSAIFTRTDCVGADANCDGVVSVPDVTKTIPCLSDPASCSTCGVPPTCDICTLFGVRSCPSSSLVER